MNIAEDIVGILDRVKVMNDGKFHKEVEEYCIKNNLDTKKYIRIFQMHLIDICSQICLLNIG